MPTYKTIAAPPTVIEEQGGALLEECRRRHADWAPTVERPGGHWTRILRSEEPHHVMLPYHIPKTSYVLESEGRVVWGVVVWARQGAYRIDEREDEWGAVIRVAEDEAPLADLWQIADLMHAIRLEVFGFSPDPLFVDQVRDASLSQHWPLATPIPEDLTGGWRGTYQQVCFQRERLPQGYVRRRLVPLLVHPDTPHAIVLPASLWPSELLAYWRGTGGELIEEEQVFPLPDVAVVDEVVGALRSGRRLDQLEGRAEDAKRVIVGVGPQEQDEALAKFGALIDEVPEERLGELVDYVTAIVARGASPAELMTPLYKRFDAMARDLGPFVEGIEERVGDEHCLEHLMGRRGDDVRRMSRVARAMIAAVFAERSLLETLRRDDAFLQALSPLSRWVDEPRWLWAAIGMISREDLVVIHVPSQRGWLGRADAIINNYQLHVLLLEQLWERQGEDLVSEPPAPAVLESYRRGGQGRPGPVRCGLNLYQYSALTTEYALTQSHDTSQHWISHEAGPSSIARLDDHLVILLGPAPFYRTWVGGATPFAQIEAHLTLEEKMTPRQLAEWLRCISKANAAVGA